MKIAVFSSHNGSDLQAIIDACKNGKVDRYILEVLDKHKIDLVFLAGYLRKIGEKTLKNYHNRIFNIHPALLPQYGGKGMYGMNVHKAVIEAKETLSGVTIHRVNEEYDEGEIVAQTMVDISEHDTPESLAKKILEREHTFLVEFLSDINNFEIMIGN